MAQTKKALIKECDAIMSELEAIALSLEKDMKTLESIKDYAMEKDAVAETHAMNASDLYLESLNTINEAYNLLFEVLR